MYAAMEKRVEKFTLSTQFTDYPDILIHIHNILRAAYHAKSNQSMRPVEKYINKI